MKKFGWIVTILIILWAGGSLYVLSKAPSALFVPAQRERSHHINDFPQDYQRDFVSTREGEKIEIITVWNPNTRNVVLYFHGNSGRIPEVIAEASRYATVVSPSYPGYSQSEGEPSEDGVYETADLAMRYIKSKGFDYSQVTVLGHSLGGTAAVYTGARYQDIHRLVLVNTLDSVYSLCKPKYSILCAFTYWYFNSGVLAHQIKVSTRVYHDKDDTVIPYVQGQQLFKEVYAADKTFETIEGTHSQFDVASILVPALQQ